METDSRFNGKRFALAGFGAEGRSTAYFLAKHGARVEVFDDKPESAFPQAMIEDLRRLGVIFYFGAMGPFNGFDAIVRSPGISPNMPQLSAAAKQGVSFTSATKIFFELCPCKIVGITGTKGKGTTSSLIYDMLRAGGRDAYLCGNIGAPALDFLDKLKPDSVVVYELSSFQLMEMDKSPHVAVALMITSDHMDFHPTLEEYVASKSNLVRFQNEDDVAVINIDYPSSRSMIALTPAKVFSVSRKEKAKEGAYVEGGAVMISTGGQTRKIMDVSDVPLAGAHNLENVGAAAMAAALLGVPDAVIADAVRKFKALPHRLELVGEVDGVKYYDDSFGTTPESAIVALEAFIEPKVLILGGSGKGADWSKFASALAASQSIRGVVGIGEEWPKIKEAILKTGKEVMMAEGLATMPEIVRAASSLAHQGDVVLLSPGCASFGMFKNYYDRGEQFAASVRAL